MIVCTTENVPGREVAEILGIVAGTFPTGRAGTEVDDARDSATRFMINEARGINADAVIGVRYTSSAGYHSSRILAYGTAVKLR